MVFPVVMYRCESWTIKKAEHWRIDAFKLWCWSSPESHLDRKEIKPVTLKVNQLWIFIGRTDAEVETLVLWLADAKCCLTGKDLNSGKDWGLEEKGVKEDEMIGWHHGLNGHEFVQLWEIVKDTEACCAAVHGVTESDMTQQLNNKLLYNVVLVSVAQWSESAICTHTFPPSWTSLLHPHPTHLSHVLIQLYVEENEMHMTHLTLLAMIKQFLLHVIILLIIFPSFVVILSRAFFICLQCWLVYILIDICAVGHYIHGKWSVYNSNYESRRNLENLPCVILLTSFILFK